MSNVDYEILVQKSRSVYQDPKVIDNFIDSNELKTCIDVFNRLPVFAPATIERATRKEHLMVNSDNPVMRNIFSDKLSALFPNENVVVDGGNFTTWHSPVTIHTDGYQMIYKPKEEIEHNQDVLGFAVLVPLFTDTGNGVPKTVFFNQKLFGESILGPGIHSDTGETITETANINNYTNTAFDRSSCEPCLLDHIPDEHLHGFSIQKVVDWVPGSAVVWHRAQFHCAGSFQGYNSKTHLVFFLNFRLQ